MIPEFPHYKPQATIPTGLRVAGSSEQKPIMKMMGKMLMAKLPKMKSPVVSQTIKVKHKKKVHYW